MQTKALVPFVALALATSLVAQDKKKETIVPGAERNSVEGKLECGTVKITYGSPTWNDKFNGEMKDGTIWRLGNNDPTSIFLDCGIMTAGGVLTPGEYGLALRYVNKTSANLVIYEGSSFYAEGLPTYEIPGTLRGDATPQKSMKIMFEGATVHVGFGPYVASIPLTCVKTHKSVETDFANVSTKISVLELDTDKPLKDTRVGVIEITQDEVRTKYDLYLTMDADKATLTFKNGDAKVIAKDKETVGGIVKMIKERAKDAGDHKAQMETVAANFEKQLKTLDVRERRVNTLHAEKTIEVKATRREAAARRLAFTHERPEGAIIFKFGARDSDAEFRINPRDFRKPRNG